MGPTGIEMSIPRDDVPMSGQGRSRAGMVPPPSEAPIFRPEPERRAEGAPACGAEDIKGILRRIAEQISESDRRHGEVLYELKERMSSLGDRASKARAEAPPAFADAFTRIEDGMAALAERLAAADRDRREVNADRKPEASGAASGHDAVASPDLALAADPRPLHATAPVVTSIDPITPLVQRQPSKLEAEPQRVEAPVFVAPKEPPAKPAPATNVSLVGDPDEPWDRASADALARMLLPEVAPTPPPSVATPVRSAEPPIRSAEPPVLGFKDTTSRAALAVSETEPRIASARLVEDERRWLEQRFTEIASRVEDSLARTRPDSSLDVLGERFEALEARFGSALEEVARQHDPQGLRQVESHMVELATQIEQTRADLTRLTAIEDHLSRIAGEIAEARVVAGASPEAAPVSGPSEQDFARLAAAAAEAAAEKAALRFSASMPTPAVAPEPDQRLDTLQELIQGFIVERREGDENAAAVLGHMQASISRLIDRVEIMERAQYGRAANGAADAESARTRRVRADLAAGSPTDTSMHDGGHAAAADLHRPDVPHGGGDPVVAQQATVRRAPVLPPTEHRAPEAGGKGDYLAQARRAARQIKPESDPAEASAAAKAQAKSEGKGKLGGFFSRGNGSGEKQGLKPVLLVAVVAFVVAGLGLVYGMMKPQITQPTKTERRMKAPPAAEGQAPAPRAPRQSGLTPTSDKVMEEAENRQPPVDEGDEQQPIQKSETENKALVPVGITVDQRSSNPTPESLERAKRTQEMAKLSTKAGTERARQQSGSPVLTGSIPTALQPLNPNETDDKPTEERTDEQQSVTGDMPPMGIGPNSLRIAAAKGDASAEFEVAMRFAEAKGVPQDFPAAARWYQRSAARGFALAQYRLATFYERGLGVPADLQRARVWYRRAAESGSVKAMHNLAVLSAGRESNAPDYATAAHWFTEAADRNLPDSQFNLAILHESGLGVTKSPAQAYKWFALAARTGDKEAARRRDLLKARLAPSEVGRIDEEIKAWRSKPVEAIANDARFAGEMWKRAAQAPNGR